MDDIEKIVKDAARAMVEVRGGYASVADSPPTLIKVEPKPDMSLEEQAKEIVGVRATERAISDEALTDGVTDRKKAEILNHAEAHLKQEQAENKKADILLQEADFGVYKGVATYAGIKKALPQKMQKILFPILGAVQIFFLLFFGIPTSLISIVSDEVESVITKLGTLAKASRRIVIAALAIGAIAVLMVVAKFFLQKFGIFA